MPLDTAGLQSDLQDLCESPPVALNPDGTANHAAMRTACSNEWGAIMESYASGIIPASTTVSSAAATLAAAMEAAFAMPDPLAIPAVEAAFLAFATTLGTGMAPAFTATPPPAPPPFAAFMAVPKPTHAAAAVALTAVIDTWMKSGTATPSGGGSTVNWT